jgi:GWxTD domain-containing protein
MTKGYNTLSLVTLFTFVLITLSAAIQDDSAHRLYLEAKKRSFNQKWDAAAELYKQLVEEYPDSRYREEAQFWVGFCLHKNGDYQEAYLAFNTLERKFPQSSWIDDAGQHKIVLAEKLASQRGDQYYSFLRTQLDHQDKETRYQAAMALGRLGDRRALPVLQSLKGQVEFDAETQNIITALEDSDDLPDEAMYAEDAIGEFDADESATTRRRFNPKDDRVNYFAEHRFEQYKSMTRQDNNWSAAELRDFGLWHILPSDTFDVYSKLTETQKLEWLRIYWKKRDPTPTTDRNEEQEEFEYRVRFARETFSYYDGLDNFHYAPWDARGEIYIKFGTPQERKNEDDGEFWHYPQYDRITFYIRPNVTNIFGRSIVISSLEGHSMRSRPKQQDWNRWRSLHTQYIYNPGFYFEYTPPRGQKIITGLTVKQIKTDQGIAFRYSMPANELGHIEQNGQYKISYAEEYVIYDNRMNEIKRNSETRNISKPTKRDLEKIETIKQDVNLNLVPGDYTLGLHIQDDNTNTVGIIKISLGIK